MLTTEQIKGKVVLLHGKRENVAPLLINTAVRMQENSKVLFIDTINCLTPQFVSKHCHKPMKSKVDKIFISRPQSVHELYSFIDRLDELFEKTKLRTLVISSINLPFNSATDNEQKMYLAPILDKIDFLTKKYNLSTFIGNTTNPKENSGSVNKVLAKKIELIYAV